MAFDFPASPTPGTSFTPAGGKPYVWDGVAWRLSGAGITTSVIIADTPPVGVVHGTLWWEADTGNTFIYYDDGDSKQWVQFNVSSLPENAVTKTAEPYNRVVNGTIWFNQEALASTTTSGTHFCDQWVLGTAGAGTYTAARVTSPTPNGSPCRARLTITAADAVLDAADLLQLYQKIEGVRLAGFNWGTASAKPVVVRFGFRGPAGTYSMLLSDETSTRTYCANFTISAGQANIDTEQVFAVPGDTSGTYSTGSVPQLVFHLGLAGGTTYQGPLGWSSGNYVVGVGASNARAMSGAIFELFDVGIYLDPEATGRPPKFQQPDYASELAACQRYWQKFDGLVMSGYNAAGQPLYFGHEFGVSFRSGPAISFNTVAYSNGSGIVISGAPNTAAFKSAYTVTAAGNSSVTYGYIANARM